MFRRRKPDGKSIIDGKEPYLARNRDADQAPGTSADATLDLPTIGRNLGFQSAEPTLDPRAEAQPFDDFAAERADPATLPADCLMIGEELKFDGAIDACDHLIVRGAAVSDIATCQKLDVSPDGHIHGTATVDEADVAGSFEGELVVHGCLRIRATGCVRGLVTYGSLEVEAGGQLLGTVRTANDPARAEPRAVVVPLRLRRHDRP